MTRYTGVVVAAASIIALTSPAQAQHIQGSRLVLSNTSSNQIAPEADYAGLNGSWFNGIDVANNGGAKDFVLLGRRDPYNRWAQDLIYIAHNGLAHANVVGAVSSSTSVNLDSSANIVVGMVVGGAGITGFPTVTAINGSTNTVTLSAPQTLSNGVNLTFQNSPTLGFGMTPPSKGTFMSQFAASDGERRMGTIGVRVGPTQTGDAIQVYDSNAIRKWGIDRTFYMTPTSVRDTATPQPLLRFHTNDLKRVYAFGYAGNSMRFRYATGAVDLLQFDPDGTTSLYNRAKFVTYMTTGVYNVAGLPNAAPAGMGARAVVEDATSNAFGTAVVGGGSIKVPVYSDGSAWYVG
jgi:hypothetical protein